MLTGHLNRARARTRARTGQTSIYLSTTVLNPTYWLLYKRFAHFDYEECSPIFIFSSSYSLLIKIKNKLLRVTSHYHT